MILKLRASAPKWASPVSKSALKCNDSSPKPLLQHKRLQSANPYWNSMILELKTSVPKWAPPPGKSLLKFNDSAPLLQTGRLQLAIPYWNPMILELKASALEWASPASRILLKFNDSGAQDLCFKTNVSSEQIRIENQWFWNYGNKIFLRSLREHDFPQTAIKYLQWVMGIGQRGQWTQTTYILALGTG